MVFDVAVEGVERAGSGVPDVYVGGDCSTFAGAARRGTAGLASLDQWRFLMAGAPEKPS